MSRHIFKIEDGSFGLTVTDPTVTDPCAAVITAFTGFTCQITSGALTASPNVTQETVPATWCDPEESLPQVGKTSYSLELAFLQDPDVVDGLSMFLFEHDTEEAWFFMGLDGADPPKAVGKCRLVAGTVGGEARLTLTATATLPVEGKPLVCFGTAATHEAVGGEPATGATAGVPGTFTPGGSTPPATVAALIAGTPNVVVASPTSAWTTGQYVQTATTGLPGRAHWSGSAWVTGPA